ncbi:hypothetical protein [Marinobacter sp. BGYM27]|uniref:hypothetical protein n=1 Tax=Marinobacter sp. BGYM27 TaxID=2975597 RepID=UPI0021A53710|nr:hypothetical protein [Marinobacter sp. BGYM27]MDG5499938.1 hypothetical protein [Marinobacter sp. BGYM27]
MSKDAYQTFIGAKGVAFTWIGAAIGPAFLRIGLDPDYRGHLVVGVVSLLLVAMSVLDGVRASKAKSLSGFMAFAVVPVALLLAGLAFALFAKV